MGEGCKNNSVKNGAAKGTIFGTSALLPYTWPEGGDPPDTQPADYRKEQSHEYQKA